MSSKKDEACPPRRIRYNEQGTQELAPKKGLTWIAV